MSSNKQTKRIIIYWAVILLQLVMTLVMTFVFSLLFPAMGSVLQSNPFIMALILGCTFGLGVFWAGWLAIRLRWLPLPPKHLPRLMGALLGAWLPLLVNALIYHGFTPGTPVFWIAALGSVVGFYALGWDEKKS